MLQIPWTDVLPSSWIVLSFDRFFFLFQEKKQKNAALGHGGYDEIAEEEFLKASGMVDMSKTVWFSWCFWGLYIHNQTNWKTLSIVYDFPIKHGHGASFRC